MLFITSAPENAQERPCAGVRRVDGFTLADSARRYTGLSELRGANTS